MKTLEQRFYEVNEELDRLDDIVGTNEGRIERHCSNHKLLKDKVEKIVKHINGYDNRDNGIISDLSDRIARLCDYVEDTNKRLDELKREQSLQTKYMTENRHKLHQHDNSITYLERDTAVNRELLKLLIAPSRFKALLERADDITYRRLHPEVFNDEGDEEY